MIREIVHINEELCDGCGLCIPGCHEGALQIIDGKARLISELRCDGLGACIGFCPQGAITIEKREAEPYDEIKTLQFMILQGKNTVFAHLKHLQEHNETGYLRQALEYIKSNEAKMPFAVKDVHELLFGRKESNSVHKPVMTACPGAASVSFGTGGFTMATSAHENQSALTHWPVQLHLINPATSHFNEADLLIAADCTAFTHGDFHRKFMAGKKMVIACPKLDKGLDIYLNKIIQLIDEAKVNTITLAIMEVPCCSGLLKLVQTALEFAEREVPVKLIVIDIRGSIVTEKQLPVIQAD